LSKPGCEIALTLAIPMPKVQVPNFVNQSREQALGQLPRISFGGGLVRGAITEVENCDYAGKVMQQVPQAGEMVDQGTSVDLVIGKCTGGDNVGPAPQQPKYILVPYVIDMWFAEAKKLLESKGLVAEYQYGDCNDLKVSNQDPHAEAYVLPGSHVKLGCPIK
jgi:beta-lactam-binding protein with PASTA domain